ncbi:17-beta-hydroxysteroid dehydrogenase 13 [Orchesella cincta]|uniref:Short-chain dehydrogenase/reductase 3 n=1 Tax=Orchesella cincta TaxID=48709 RepID=A0A1D2MJ34_ORCCI|nr:17-beta-hydroxysteroid dehydrogenase 13 [Orchesella cincta]
MAHSVGFLFLCAQLGFDLWIYSLYTIYSLLENFYRFFFPVRRKSLDKEIILITGSAIGIGRAICLQLAAKTKAKLVLWDVRKDENDELTEILRQFGTQAWSYHVDLCSRSQIESAAERVKREVGDVSVVINNAGICNPVRFLDECQNPETIERAFHVNVLSNFWILAQFLPQMVIHGHGHIATLSFLGSSSTLPFLASYNASKFAQFGLMATLQDEMQKDPWRPDIKFTTAFATFTDTALTSGQKITYRYPFILSTLDTTYVAKCVIEAIQRNKECVYIPWYMEIFVLLQRMIPTRVRRISNKLLFDLELTTRSVEFSRNHAPHSHSKKFGRFTLPPLKE